MATLRLVLALVLLALAPACSTTPGREAADEPPRLLVLIVVDQLPRSLVEAAAPLATGGLARLLSERAHRAVAAHETAITATGPGHANIATGTWPRTHGIVGNHWYEGDRLVNCADPALLEAETVADVVERHGGLVASLSHKDRGARLLGGRKPDLVAWLDGTTLAWVGAGFLPPAEAYRTSAWTPLHPEAYAARGPDDVAQEADWYGLGRTFPHPATAGLAPRAFLATPAAGTLLTDAAVATIARFGLGQDSTPDLLALSYSHTDYAGHAFGPQSWEALDTLLRLDAELGRLFSALDEGIGPDRWTVVLTSDHGAPPLPGAYLQRSAVAEASGGRFDPPGIWLPAGTDRAAAKAAVARLPGVAAVFETARVDGDEPVATMVRRSVFPGRSGDFHLVMRPGAVVEGDDVPQYGTEHGSPWPWDVEVPLLAHGAGIVPGESGVVPATRIAPTLAKLLGVPAPGRAEEAPIANMLRGSPLSRRTCAAVRQAASPPHRPWWTEQAVVDRAHPRHLEHRSGVVAVPTGRSARGAPCVLPAVFQSPASSPAWPALPPAGRAARPTSTRCLHRRSAPSRGRSPSPSPGTTCRRWSEAG